MVLQFYQHFIKDGVKNGKYYASVIIPEDFSENLFSVTSGAFDQATLHYYSNEKSNAIAPKITDKGSEAIESAVKSAYVDKLTEVLAAALNLTESEISDSKEEVADKVLTALENAKSDIDDFKILNKLFITTLDSLDGVMKSNKGIESELKATLSKVGVVRGDVAKSVEGMKKSANHISDMADGLFDLTSDYAKDIDSQYESAVKDIEKDEETAIEKLNSIKGNVEKIVSINNVLIEMFQKLSDSFDDVDFSDIIGKLQSINTKQNELISKLDTAVEKIREKGEIPDDLRSDLKTYISDVKKEINNSNVDFSNVKSSLNKTVNDSSAVLDDVSGFMTSLGSGESGIQEVIKSGRDTIAGLKKTFKGVDKILDNTKKKINKLMDKIKDARDDETIENLLIPIIENPEALGNFIANPVATEKHRVFPIDNYGSAMTPFYTSLGLWVGGVVLVAVIAVALSKKEREYVDNPRDHQVFFGRYLIFFVMGQIQALVIALGDLFFLKIQCENPVLFVVASLISSFVYTLFIYSLTITFSVLGKALSVIILVIQVAGSGGTFPVQVLPYAFKVLYPYLPFHYGINAMREAVAGADLVSYWKNIGFLSLFIFVALFIGLVLRKPCIGAIEFFNKKIEESDLVV